MKPLICLLVLTFCFGCSGQSEKSHSKKTPITEIERTIQSIPDKIKNLQELSLVQESETYESIKKEVEDQRQKLASKDLSVDSIGHLFKESLVNKIIPFWEGTRWTFEGHTSIPQTGSIACGYFVSTTLKDVGLNVNRYKLAQQSPINEAKSLAINKSVKEFSASSTRENIVAINENLKEGIHFIGFDQSHVGYILKEQNDLYLIHSNYINAKGVMIEKIEESKVFKAFSNFYIVELSTNEQLLDFWKQKKLIEIIQ